MSKEIKEVDNVDKKKRPVAKHSAKVKKLDTTSDELNMKVYHPQTPEENYEFNTKTKIPSHMEIGYIDGNKDNKVFANLKLVPKKK